MFKCGVLLTVVYFLILGFVIIKLGLSPVGSWNELGDFLAGAFSPVAFLWLVLGYLQQQKELQQNTQALMLQAEELKGSVEQATNMVAIAKNQFDLERTKYDSEIQKNLELNKPQLDMYFYREFAGDDLGLKISDVTLRNVGGLARNVRVFHDDVEIGGTMLPFHSIRTHEEVQFNIRILMEGLPRGDIISVRCTDLSGNPYEYKFDVHTDINGRASIKRFA